MEPVQYLCAMGLCLRLELLLTPFLAQGVAEQFAFPVIPTSSNPSTVWNSSCCKDDAQAESFIPGCITMTGANRRRHYLRSQPYLCRAHDPQVPSYTHTSTWAFKEWLNRAVAQEALGTSALLLFQVSIYAHAFGAKKKIQHGPQERGPFGKSLFLTHSCTLLVLNTGYFLKEAHLETII